MPTAPAAIPVLPLRKFLCLLIATALVFIATLILLLLAAPRPAWHTPALCAFIPLGLLAAGLLTAAMHLLDRPVHPPAAHPRATRLLIGAYKRVLLLLQLVAMILALAPALILLLR